MDANDATIESGDFFRLAVEAAPNAMVMVGPHGRIGLVNRQAEKLFGYSRDELIGASIEMLVPDRVRDGHARLREDYLRDPHARAMGAGRDLTARRKDGTEVPVEIGLNPIITAQGTLVLAAIVDITERKRIERERLDLEASMRHSQKLESLGVLAGGIAHDFNNLLGAILGNAEIALAKLVPGSPASTYLQNIFSASRRAAELTRQMLAYSGRGKLETKRLDVSEAVREMANLLKVSVSKKATLHFKFVTGLAAVEADPAQINQVIMNLITNASEALEDRPGDIYVRTGAMYADEAYLRECFCEPGTPAGDYVFFEVEDTGCGMDEATIARIYEPFFTTKFTGRGLGLSAVQGIVRGHRGAMRVVSRPGVGSRMRVLLPALNAPHEAARAAAAAGQWRASGIVLLADDEDLVRAVTKAQLESLGFDVVEAVDGQEAVDLYTKRAPLISLAVLDLTMPRMDGDEAARRMLTLRPDLPVVIASGYSSQELSNRLREQPTVTVLAKPFTLADILAACRRALKL